jgi:hypothetical protein
MPLQISPQESGIHLVREDTYIIELASISLTDRRFASIAKHMEREIIAYSGSPPGSYNIHMSLVREFPAEIWELSISHLEKCTPGAAHLAIRLIEKQRIYEKDGVAIVYTLVNIGELLVLVLQTVNVYEGNRFDFLNKLLNMYP